MEVTVKNYPIFSEPVYTIDPNSIIWISNNTFEI